MRFEEADLRSGGPLVIGVVATAFLASFAQHAAAQ
jgi:hypothetical protein